MNVLLRIEVRGLAEFVGEALVPHGHRVVHLAPVDGSLDAEHHRSDVAIVDVHALDPSAADNIRSLRGRFGEVPLLALDTGLSARERVEILEAGADTLVTMPCTPYELAAHVHALGRIRGAARAFAASCIAARLPEARLQALTEREVDVLRLLARGQTDQEIAATLHVAARTARFHVGSILRKLLARNRAHAAVLGALFDLLQVEFAAGAPLHRLSSGSV